MLFKNIRNRKKKMLKYKRNQSKYNKQSNNSLNVLTIKEGKTIKRPEDLKKKIIISK